MGRMSEVLDELEAIGAVGDKVVLLRLEAPRTEAVVRMAPPLRVEVPESELLERVKLVHEVCEESLQTLAVVAKQVQDLQKVFERLAAATDVEPEGEQNAEVHQET